MVRITQYEFQWGAVTLPPAPAGEKLQPSPAKDGEGPAVLPPPNGFQSDASVSSATINGVVGTVNEAQSSEDTVPPVPPVLPNPFPLPESVALGVFGIDEDQLPIAPTPEEIEAIKTAHAERLLSLHDVVVEAELALAVRQDQDRGPLYQTKDQAVSAYQRGVARYAEDFGPQAAGELETWLRHRAATGEGEWNYPPDHPWHYLQRGDGEIPLPVEDIRPAPEISHPFTLALPKNQAKRQEKLQSLLHDQEVQLATDRKRYTQIAEGGPGVLSDFDRNIAHAGDEELAWASAVALKHCQIRNGLHRIAWLREQLDRPPRQTPEG